MNVSKILNSTTKVVNIFIMILNVFFILGQLAKTVKTQLDMNNPIITESFTNQMLFQDVLKIVLMCGVSWFQLKMFRKGQYLISILLVIVSVLIYNFRNFLL